jgi:hypothetical protein
VSRVETPALPLEVFEGASDSDSADADSASSGLVRNLHMSRPYYTSEDVLLAGHSRALD